MKSFKRPFAILVLFGSAAAASRDFVGIATSHESAPRVVARAEDPLPSWNDSPSKKAILDLVKRVTDRESKEYVAPADRIATFDNDGTLWCEQPMYVELAFSFDRIKTLAPSHPEWKEKEPFKSLLAGDLKAVMEMGERAMGEIAVVAHADTTADEFIALAKDWLATARHPKYHRPYTECVYQPMLELLAFMRANGFKTFIVSGGGVEFMRAFAEKVYGVPREQVIGSRLKTKVEAIGGKPVLMRIPEVEFIDDGNGKPIAIQDWIGRRPCAAFGNSDGDLAMLEWTWAGDGARLGMFVHHTDAEREYAYDRKSPIGTLNKGLDVSEKKGWPMIDMKKDWKTIFP